MTGSSVFVPFESDVVNTTQLLSEVSLDILTAASNVSWGGFYPNLQVPVVNFYPPGQSPESSELGSMGIPPVPAEPDIFPVDAAVLPAKPVFSEPAPLLANIVLPDPFTDSIAGAPILTDVLAPEAADLVLPDVPTLAGLNLPSAPDLSVPSFLESVVESPIRPNVEFIWAEIEYNSDLLTSLRSKLYDVVSGLPTGVSEKAEAAMWNAARDDIKKGVAETLGNVVTLHAGKGFNFHGGDFVRKAGDAVLDGMRKESDRSREIMKEQANLEHSNRMFAITSGLALETKLIDKHRKAQSRLFESVKFALEAVLKVFSAEVLLYLADAKVLAVNAEVFKTRLQAALVDLEVYKARLEGLKVTARINESHVRLFSARVAGVLLKVDEYRSKIEAASVTIEDYESKIRLFGSKIKSIAAVVDAKSAEYRNYSEAIKGEVSKVRSVTLQAEAFRTQVDAYKTLVDATASKQELTFKQTQKMPVELYKAQIEAFKTLVDAEVKRISAVVQVIESKVDVYQTEENFKSKDMSLQAGTLTAIMTGYTASANAALGAADASARIAAASSSLSATTDAARMQIAAMTSAASISANTTNYSTNESSSESYSESCNKSVSKTKSCVTRSGTRSDLNGVQVRLSSLIGTTFGGPTVTGDGGSGGGCGC